MAEDAVRIVRGATIEERPNMPATRADQRPNWSSASHAAGRTDGARTSETYRRSGFSYSSYENTTPQAT